MKILHIKSTNLAQAPDELSKAFNRYSDIKSELQFYDQEIRGDYDAIIHHNVYKPNNLSVREIIMYHSEPSMVHLNPPNHVVKTVIAQYHCTLPEFKDCQIVRNVIDFNKDIYQIKQVDKIKIGFSPSVIDPFGQWHNKGYRETKKILEELKEKYSDKFEYDIITNVSLEDCLARKAQCNVFIDEVITGSYHRSGLEGLALGKLTICNISPGVQQAIKSCTGSDHLPFMNMTINNLKDDLSDIIENYSVEKINKIGAENRKWMEKYWTPQNILKDFTKLF